MGKIELNIVENPDCHKKCSKEQRKERTIDDICVETLSIVDKLPVRCVGDWAKEKIFHLVQYFGIFSQGMKNRWNGINYIEICSGPGRCINRETGEEFDGTALAIAKHKNVQFLKNALFFDFNSDIVTNLNERISALGIKNASAYTGDYSDSITICSVLKEKLPEDHLNLVFIDPTDCSVPFELVRGIHSSIKNIDFVINVASGTDFNRNVVRVIENQNSYWRAKEKYSMFLGSEEFFKDSNLAQLAKNKDHKQIRLLFRNYYENSLKAIGYQYFGYKHIMHYYDLIFATKHERGLDFWEKASAIDYNGQRELFF